MKMVKIFFKNGSVMEGKIKKSSKKKMVVKTKTGDKLIIFNPHEVIMMIIKSKKEKQIKPRPVESISSDDPQIIVVDQIWENIDTNHKKWKVIDIIDQFVIMENKRITIDVDKNTLNSKYGWKLLSSPVVNPDPVFDLDRDDETSFDRSFEPSFETLPPEVLPTPIISTTIEDLGLRSKKLAELHLLKKKVDLESVGKKMRTPLMPDKSSKVQIYDVPNFTKPGPSNNPSTQNS